MQAGEGLLWNSAGPYAATGSRAGAVGDSDISLGDAETWGRETYRPNATEPEYTASLRSRLKRFAATFDERAAVYGSCGFVLGVIAWHMVGFWSFVSDVVLHDPMTAQAHVPVVAKVFAAADNANGQAAAAPGLTTGALGGGTKSSVKAPMHDAGACAALEFDRASGLTRRIPCAIAVRDLKDAGFQMRADRATAAPMLQNAQAWASATETKSEQVEVETAPAAPSDFDLTIKSDQ